MKAEEISKIIKQSQKDTARIFNQSQKKPKNPDHCRTEALFPLSCLSKAEGVDSLFDRKLAPSGTIVRNTISDCEIAQIASLANETQLHDSHYADKQIEPILVQEQIVSQEGTLDPKARLFVAQAMRYLMRAGCKQGEPANKDLDKALNYIYRARHGVWMPVNGSARKE